MSGKPTPPYARLTAFKFSPPVQCAPEDVQAHVFRIEYGLEWDASVHLIELPALGEARSVLATIREAFELGARYQRLVALQIGSEVPPDDETLETAAAARAAGPEGEY